jgi:4-hydroxy-3-methylbut-2-enyl diphosphate reductase
MKIYLANPRGFCAGVERAIEIVVRALELFGAPVYVRHEIVHNTHVVEDLKARGAIFVEELSEIPNASIAIFSAHGVSLDVQAEAKERSLRVFDATCPLVIKVHMEVARLSRLDHPCILIGHANHPEVIGTLGHYQSANSNIYLVENSTQARQLVISDHKNLAYVTQTTLSVDETKAIISVLKERFPEIIGPKRDDICYATQNRQNAVRELAQLSDLVLVVGSPSSSNSNRLKELSEQLGTSAYLIDDLSQIKPEWLNGKQKVGITAGASAPEIVVQKLISYLEQEWQAISIEEVEGVPENMVFSLPKELRETIAL